MLFGSREVFSYLECANCGTIQIRSVPELSRYYPPNYYSFGSLSDFDHLNLKKRFTFYLGRLIRRCAAHYYLRNKGLPGDAVFFQKLVPNALKRVVIGFPNYLKDTKLNLNLTTKSAILDFGSGAGHTLQALRHFGFDHLTGVDPFIERPITLGSHAKVLRAHLSEISGEFDLVLANHSFEHVPDPVSTIRQMHRVLKLGHYAIIRMPIVSDAWRRYGTNWVQLDPPRHIFLFTPEVFSKLAGEAGFRVDEIKYDSNAFQFWGSEQCVQDIALLDERSYFVDPKNSIFSTKQIEAFECEATKLNERGQGDQATFYLYKS